MNKVLELNQLLPTTHPYVERTMSNSQIRLLANILAKHSVSHPVGVDVSALNKLKARAKPVTIHHTMGVYNNGDRKHNGVHPDDLKDHIEYNLRMRPGRAFFVDGVCLNNGYLDDERIAAIVQELKETPVVMGSVTLPYQ